ncbi:MAG: ClpXP protease specificity-enhancing factor [Serpentinimonas sp.]|nr:MAG: hypothetical protein JM57_01920 [Comamonadaceae bacterium BICA1-1]MDO9611221.1 ClpXP protease specificity-enhancing factor [Serpentinimonas sp.]
MSPDTPPAPPSTRPYLIRALHEWCSDNGFTPYMVVAVGATVRVPREFVHNGQIVLNTSYEATSHLQLGNEMVEFKARFGGVPRDVQVPIDHVLAIYAQENGQGMAFEAPALTPHGPEAKPVQGARPSLKVVDADDSTPPEPESRAPAGEPEPEPPTPPKPGGSPAGRPALRRVK